MTIYSYYDMPIEGVINEGEDEEEDNRYGN